MTKIKPIFIALTIFLSFGVGLKSVGAIDVPKIPVPGFGGGSSDDVDIDALTGKQSELVKSMTKALLNLSKSQAKFLEALGEKEAAIAAGMYISALEKGEAIGKDDLEKALVQSKESQKIIDKKLAEQKVLEAEAKVTFAKGIPPYGKGVGGLAVTGLKAKETVDSIGANPSPMIITKVGSLFFIAKETPGAISMFANSTSTMINFATKNKIDTKPLEEAKSSLGD
tara:strand:- start:2644 stop:3321 length:678 start_codon:yes stop_codon:yes gene_type:complete